MRLAAEALEGGSLTTKEYNRAMTELIGREFERLGIVSREKALEIFESVRGQWYTSGRLMKRNMDIGLDDGHIHPCIIPGFTEEPPAAIDMPALEGLERTGIGVTCTITSFYFETAKLKKMAGVNSDVQPVRDYPAILKEIEREAVEDYGYMVR